MADQDGDSIPLSRGTYKIDWDAIDENTNPFQLGASKLIRQDDATPTPLPTLPSASSPTITPSIDCDNKPPASSRTMKTISRGNEKTKPVVDESGDHQIDPQEEAKAKRAAQQAQMRQKIAEMRRLKLQQQEQEKAKEMENEVVENIISIAIENNQQDCVAASSSSRAPPQRSATFSRDLSPAKETVDVPPPPPTTVAALACVDDNEDVCFPSVLNNQQVECDSHFKSSLSSTATYSRSFAVPPPPASGTIPDEEIVAKSEISEWQENNLQDSLELPPPPTSLLLSTTDSLTAAGADRHHQQQPQQQQQQSSIENTTLLEELQAKEEELNNLSARRDHMRSMLESYEVILVGLLDQEKLSIQEHLEMKQRISLERDQANEDLDRVHKAFQELHKRHEKTKLLLQNYKDNESQLTERINAIVEYNKLIELKYSQLRKHAEGKLNNAKLELNSIKNSHTGDIELLKSTLKRSELQVRSLEQQLMQKTNENVELTKICDELLGKHSAK